MKAKIDTGQISFFSNGENLIDYTIYGAIGGVGERTENLFNSADSEQGFYLDDQGETTQNSNYLTSAFIPVSADASYTISLINHYPIGGWYFRVALYDASQNFIDFAVKKVYGGDSGAVLVRTDSFTIGEAELIRFCCLKINLDVMLNVGSQAMSYEPYGYKIPVTCGGETTNIYLDELLHEDDSITFSTAQVNIPTNNGQNTLTVDTQVKPSKIMVKTNEGIFQNPPENKSFSDYHYNRKMDTRNEILRAWATRDGGRIVPKSWNHAQFLVKHGLHQDIFYIGDELVCKRGNDDIIWQVIGMDIDEPADPQYKHSLTLCTKNLLPNVLIPFSAKQALFYFPNGLTAGTYYFTVTEHSWVTSDINKSFYFTLNKDIPAKGQIVVQNNYNVSFNNATLKTYASSTSITAIETAIMSLWNDSIEADFLGNVNDNLQTNINCLIRAFMGNCNYAESSIRQWLNRGEGNNTSWNEQTVFDRPTSYDISSLGFLKNIDNDFIKVIKPTKVKIAKSIFTENEGFSMISDTIKDRFFLLSKPQVFGETVTPNINEGIVYPYFGNYSDLNVAGTGADKNRIKTLNGNSEQYWLRSFLQNNAFGNAAVTKTGVIDGWYNVQAYGLGVAVACNIFG